MKNGQVYNRSFVASGIHKSNMLHSNKNKNIIENIADSLIKWLWGIFNNILDYSPLAPPAYKLIYTVLSTSKSLSGLPKNWDPLQQKHCFYNKTIPLLYLLCWQKSNSHKIMTNKYYNNTIVKDPNCWSLLESKNELLPCYLGVLCLMFPLIIFDWLKFAFDCHLSTKSGTISNWLLIYSTDALKAGILCHLSPAAPFSALDFGVLGIFYKNITCTYLEGGSSHAFPVKYSLCSPRCWVGSFSLAKPTTLG